MEFLARNRHYLVLSKECLLVLASMHQMTLHELLSVVNDFNVNVKTSSTPVDCLYSYLKSVLKFGMDPSQLSRYRVSLRDTLNHI